MKTYFCERSGSERPPLIKEQRKAAALHQKHVKNKSPALSGGKSRNSPALSQGGRSEASFVGSVIEGAAKICGTDKQRGDSDRVCFGGFVVASYSAELLKVFVKEQRSEVLIKFVSHIYLCLISVKNIGFKSSLRFWWSS